MDDLRLMLKAELGKDLESIVTPKNLREAIEKVISLAEQGDWVRDLLIAARSRQPGNQKLKDAAARMLGNAQKQLPELLHIVRETGLSPDPGITEACYKQSWPAGWEPSPRQYDEGVSVRNYAYELAEYEHLSDGTFPLLDFVSRLCAHAKLNDPDASRLKKWLENSRDQLQPRMIRKKITRGEPKKRLYVLVTVTPREMKPGRYGVQAWLLGAADKPSLFPEEVETAAEQIESLMDPIRQKLMRPPYNVNLRRVNIEVFLPRNLLQLAVDGWRVRPFLVEAPAPGRNPKRKKPGPAPPDTATPAILPTGLKLPPPKPLGLLHHVVVRPIERVLYRGLLDFVIDRWPEEIQENDCFTVLEPEGPLEREGDKLIAVLIGTPAPGKQPPDYYELFYNNQVHCCLFGVPPPDAGAPGPDPLSDLILTGIPMAIWAREPFPEVELQSKLRKLILKHSVAELPQVVHDLRSKPSDEKETWHLGQAVTLFYDDPNRLPQAFARNSRLGGAEEGE